MLDNKIKLIVLDISQTKVKGVNSTLFLYEVYRQLAEIEKNNVKTAQKEGISNAIKEKRPYGRPRAEYPKNWETLYKKWKSKKISSQEFIDASGLKKPTFYNMLKNYMVSIGDLKGNDTIRLRKTGT